MLRWLEPCTSNSWAADSCQCFPFIKPETQGELHTAVQVDTMQHHQVGLCKHLGLHPGLLVGCAAMLGQVHSL